MAVKLYRWTVFLLAGFYVIWFTLLDGDYSHLGGPFRHLTFWALLFSFFSASRMMAMLEGRSERDWPALVLTTATLNFMVVFLYWRLWFADPANVNATGENEAWIEYYVHLLGPVLQWIDMLFIHRRARRIWRALGLTLFVVGSYVFWIEIVLQRFNDFPYGTVTSGIPYPFLNNMAYDGRVSFYLQTTISAVVVLFVFWALAQIIQRATNKN